MQDYDSLYAKGKQLRLKHLDPLELDESSINLNVFQPWKQLDQFLYAQKHSEDVDDTIALTISRDSSSRSINFTDLLLQLEGE